MPSDSDHSTGKHAQAVRGQSAGEILGEHGEPLLESLRVVRVQWPGAGRAVWRPLKSGQQVRPDFMLPSE